MVLYIDSRVLSKQVAVPSYVVSCLLDKPIGKSVLDLRDIIISLGGLFAMGNASCLLVLDLDFGGDEAFLII